MSVSQLPIQNYRCSYFCSNDLYLSSPCGLMLCCRCVQRASALLARQAALRGCNLSWRGYSELEGGRGKFEKENIVTVPNLLSVGRVALSPVTGYMVLESSYSYALGLFAVVGITDVLDGYIARRFKGQSSNLGSVLDPLADKVFMSVLCVSMTYMELLPVSLVVVILGRDVLLIGASFYLRYITLPPPRTLSRYWDIQRSTVQVTPNILGKANTVLQLMSVGVSLCCAAAGMPSSSLLHALWAVTGVTTVSSGVSYLYRMKGFKILSKPSNKPP